MPQGPRLYVEGKNDVHVVGNLLERHELRLDPKGGDPSKPIIEATKTADGDEGGVEHLIRTSSTIIKAAGGKTVGFVIDADPDVGLAARWNRIRDQFASVGVDVPNTIPINGFIGETQDYKVRVGAWLMQDNQRDGTLETFLKDLIDGNDALIGIAQSSTQIAMQTERRFPHVALSKAELHTWLAWQENPGCPYGVAIKARYFHHDSPVALAFVDWFRRLYDL